MWPRGVLLCLGGFLGLGGLLPTVEELGDGAHGAGIGDVLLRKEGLGDGAYGQGIGDVLLLPARGLGDGAHSDGIGNDLPGVLVMPLLGGGLAVLRISGFK